MSEVSSANQDALDAFELAGVEWAGTAYGQPLVDAAVAALVAGIDTPTLRLLAGARAQFADAEASEFAPAVFAELGLAIPEKLSDDAFMALARVRATQFLETGAQPRALAGELKSLYEASGYRVELSAFSGHSEEYWLLENSAYGGIEEAIDEAVRESAQRLVDR